MTMTMAGRGWIGDGGRGGGGRGGGGVDGVGGVWAFGRGGGGGGAAGGGGDGARGGGAGDSCEPGLPDSAGPGGWGDGGERAGRDAGGGGAAAASGQRAVAQTDAAVCHLESQLTSNHVKGEVVNGAVQRSVVVVKEQEYLLQDEFQTPVVFVVEQAVPDGWKVDSDPQPTRMEGKVALFQGDGAAGADCAAACGRATYDSAGGVGG